MHSAYDSSLDRDLFSIALGLADTGRFRDFATLAGVMLLALPERAIGWHDLVARTDVSQCLAARCARAWERTSAEAGDY